MFCKKCGKELPVDATFCGSCGANQENGVAPNTQTYKQPNYEFKTVRCYPSSSEENAYKKFYEDCGWQILDMDRKQVFEGQDSYGTSHYSTQTHIKMQRDKNHPNYAKIEEISEDAESCFESSPNLKAMPTFSKASCILIILGPIAWIFLIFYGISYSSAKKKITMQNDKAKERYYKNKRKCDELRAECIKLVSEI